jgi:hypothetical protein
MKSASKASWSYRPKWLNVLLRAIHKLSCVHLWCSPYPSGTQCISASSVPAMTWQSPAWASGSCEPFGFIEKQTSFIPDPLFPDWLSPIFSWGLLQGVDGCVLLDHLQSSFTRKLKVRAVLRVCIPEYAFMVSHLGKSSSVKGVAHLTHWGQKHENGA